MGREVRRVPANWQHPKDGSGFKPLRDGFTKALRDWNDGNAKWQEGLREDWSKYPAVAWIPLEAEHTGMTFAEWHGEQPQAGDYMPDWPEAERTHLQMYEDTTEGTPISPVMDSPELLAAWLADTGASAFGGMGASYEGWLRVCNGGFAPSMVMSGNVMQSGVDALKDHA